MIIKKAKSYIDRSIKIDESAILADPEIIARFNKFASKIRSIAPKSDDFLYFSIIFLKSAESSLIDDSGVIKKLSSGEDAWGHFDKNWKWHGNVQPHKNNNGDIFPESELKKAAPDWIGMPLCRDHESSSVDGIRGIILDTYYDEKLKQVVGLCALDRINYPDLARKVETGLVRYGSMGTAVENSICTECSNVATTLDEYCEHVTDRTAYGEINVGLKPIEYSLVVQPAEPGARLLSCIASLNNYRKEFIDYGVDNFDSMVSRLNESQAEHLSNIMKAACSNDGCSIPQRRKIVAEFLKKNGLVKRSYSESTTPDEASEFARAMNDLRSAIGYTYEQAAERRDENEVATAAYDAFKKVLEAFTSDDSDLMPEEDIEGPLGESFTYPETAAGGESLLPEGSALPTGADGGTTMSAGVSEPWEERPDVFDAGGVLPDKNIVQASGKESKSIIKSLMEDIMNESRLRKRAEQRRKIAYHQGGADGVEPNTYKSEPFDKNQDKQMQQDGNLGGTDGMVPGDKEVKEKLSRAELEERRLRRTAYHQGGADGVEPNTYKSEPFDRNQDKQMHQTGNMGGDKGTFPGDMEKKKLVQRAAYRGPGLRTKFSHKKGLDGKVDRVGSRFDIFAGDKRVISTTAGAIFGPELDANWEWINSREYAKEVVAQIRENGLSYVGGLLKSAQEALELPDLPALPDAMELGDDAGTEGAPELLESEEPVEETAEDPREAAENALLAIEQEVVTLRDLLKDMGGEEEVNINIDLDSSEEVAFGGEGLDEISLASNVFRQVKTALVGLRDSADELSMINETYANVSNLTRGQAAELRNLTYAAVRDSNHMCGESRALTKMAKSLAPLISKAAIANNAEANEPTGVAKNDVGSEVSSLVSEAVSMRRRRRERILVDAESKVLSQRRAKREKLAKRAMDTLYVHDQEDDATSEADDAVATNEVDDAVATSEADDAVATNEVDDAVATNEVDGAVVTNEVDGVVVASSYVQSELAKVMDQKAAESDRDSYRLKLRRAYDVGMDMQRKGLVASTKPSLDRQVDEIMLFDDRAFEAFKRSVANAKAIKSIKIASDLGGINVGIDSSEDMRPVSTIDALVAMWS
jgi:hypothetical protein